MGIATIALKNLSRQKRRSFLLGGAIAFGIMIVATVNGLVGGIVMSLEQNASYLAAGHIYYTEAERTEKGRVILGIKDEKLVQEAAAEVNKKYPVKYTVRRSSPISGAVLLFQGSSSFQSVEGVDWNNDIFLKNNIELLPGSSIDDMAGSNGIILPEKAAEYYNVKIGEEMILKMSTVYGQQNVEPVVVKGIYKDGSGLNIFSSYLDYNLLNKLMDMPQNSFNVVGIFLEDFGKIDAATQIFYDTIRQKTPQMSRDKLVDKSFQKVLQDVAKDDNYKESLGIISNINDNLKIVRDISLTINLVLLGFLGILLIVIIVGIYNTYRIIVLERTREIGTMRSLGMQKSQTRNLFLFESFFLACGGVLLGLILSFALQGLLGMMNLSEVPSLGFFLNKGHLASRFDLVILGLNIFLVLSLTVLAAFFPARKAGNLNPAEALRTVF